MSGGTHIKQVLDLVVEALEKLYNDKNLFIEYDIESDIKFLGDENDLMEIFGNLLDNACKYAKKHIQITIRALENLTLIIEDDGKGLGETHLHKIFHRGERLDTKGLGQGIGLAVVFDIVKSYEGQITAGSSPLGGAQFTITIPNGVKTSP